MSCMSCTILRQTVKFKILFSFVPGCTQAIPEKYDNHSLAHVCAHIVVGQVRRDLCSGAQNKGATAEPRSLVLVLELWEILRYVYPQYSAHEICPLETQSYLDIVLLWDIRYSNVRLSTQSMGSSFQDTNSDVLVRKIAELLYENLLVLPSG